MGVSQSRRSESVAAHKRGEFTTCDISEDLILLIPNAVARETAASVDLGIQTPDIDGALSETELQDLMASLTSKITS